MTREFSSNTRNRHIAQPGMNIGQDRQMQMVGGNGGNQFRQYVGQNVGNLNRINNPNTNQNRNANVVATRAKEDLDEIEEVNANCILMANFQQASTSVLRLTKLPFMIQMDQLRSSKFVYGASTQGA
nr:hypothetical protein [Tanacetum cinerariifolium]